MTPKNPYKVLTRPRSKRADIIRAMLPSVYDDCCVYATCDTVPIAKELCRLLNVGLDVEVVATKPASMKEVRDAIRSSGGTKPKKKQK